MIEYYLLKCECVMTAEKIKDGVYRYRVILPRCVQSKKEKTDYISDNAPTDYDGKLLTKLEATIEILKGK